MGQDRDDSFLPRVLYGKGKHMSTTEDILRIPVSKSVSYAVRGLPGIPTRYARDIVLVPNHLTFTYRASPDEQLGRVQAFVRGWWMTGDKRAADEVTTERYVGDMNTWPVWLAEEARRHDPDNHMEQLAADEAAVERVARCLIGDWVTDESWAQYGEETRTEYREYARKVIACAAQEEVNGGQ